MAIDPSTGQPMVNIAPQRGVPGQTYQPAPAQPYPTTPGTLDPYSGGQSGAMVQTYGTGGSTAAKIKNGANGLLNSAFPGPATPDTSGIQQAQGNAFQTANNLANERQDYQGTVSPGMQQGSLSNLGQAAAQNNGALSNLQQAAAQNNGALFNLQQAAQGNVPSAAQLQAQQQAQQGAAQQFGIASALQGGQSGGNALRNAQEGAGNLVANVANQGAVNRANEMAQARDQYANATGQATGQYANATGQATDQYANAVGAARGQDQDWQKALLGGQLQSNQTAATAAGTNAQVQQQGAAATNAYNASPYGMIGNIGKKVFSWL